MTNAEYHSGPGYSKSHLDKIADAPIEYWHHYLNPDREVAEPGDALVLGTVIHTAVLEPDILDSAYKVLPDLDLRTKAGRAERDAFKAAHPGATIITVDQLATAKAVRDAVYRHPLASRLLRGGQSELSFFATDPETGELIKCRTDSFNTGAGMIVDLKSTDDASPDGFGKSCANFRYYVQPPWYQDVLRAAYGEAPPWWVFLAVEKKPPYKIGVYYPTPEQIELGRRVARRDFKRILECKASGVWPDYATEVKPVELPGWAVRNIERSLAP
jgi:exodeoxyribonuclease VIII